MIFHLCNVCINYKESKMNELKTLINKYIKLNNLKRSQLALKLGYENITGGLRKFDQFIDEPTYDNPIKLELQSSLQIPHDEMELAIKQRLEYFEEENKRRFKPFIQRIVSSIPSPIFVAALAPKLWNIAIDAEIQLFDYDDEIKIVISKYQQLQLEHAKNKSVKNYDELVSLLNDGDVNNKPYSWVFGKGFRYFRKYGETLIFNRECILQEVSKTEQPSIAYAKF